MPALHAPLGPSSTLPHPGNTHRALPPLALYMRTVCTVAHVVECLVAVELGREQASQTYPSWAYSLSAGKRIDAQCCSAVSVNPCTLSSEQQADSRVLPSQGPHVWLPSSAPASPLLCCGNVAGLVEIPFTIVSTIPFTLIIYWMVRSWLLHRTQLCHAGCCQSRA